MNVKKQREVILGAVNRVKHKGWNLCLATRENTFGIYWEWTSQCCNTGSDTMLHSRVHFLDIDVRDSAAFVTDLVIKTARGALHEALSHEADEFFTVDNKRLYDPHLTIATLLRLANE